MAESIKQQLELLKRGTVEIFNEDELAERLKEAAKERRQLRVKLGMDPTSPDIHLGHTVVMRKMRQFQDMGHKAVLIIGDYTARIGDPTGQNTTRPMLEFEQIEKNAKTYLAQAGKILDTSKEKLEVKSNSQWLADLKLADIIKLASTMTVARMLERDTFELRHKAGEPISIHEFLYPLMQGYDSVMIKADVELGGTDQTFNNLVGRDLQRLNGQAPQIVITMPILVGLDGKEKMSKSKGNYIGVTDEPKDMFGKIMSISDDMMENYFTLLTDIDADKIKELVNPQKTHPKEAKILLAKTIVDQFCGDVRQDESISQKGHDLTPDVQQGGMTIGDISAAYFDKVFSQKQLPDDMPTVQIKAEPIAAARLLLSCKLVSTGGEAKRLVAQGGVTINGEKINDPNELITPASGMIVRAGKRKFVELSIVE